MERYIYIVSFMSSGSCLSFQILSLQPSSCPLPSNDKLMKRIFSVVSYLGRLDFDLHEPLLQQTVKWAHKMHDFTPVLQSVSSSDAFVCSCTHGCFVVVLSHKLVSVLQCVLYRRVLHRIEADRQRVGLNTKKQEAPLHTLLSQLCRTQSPTHRHMHTDTDRQTQHTYPHPTHNHTHMHLYAHRQWKACCLSNQ